MVKKSYFIVILVFLLSISISIAQETTYNEIGDVEGDYQRGLGIFNTELTSSETTGNVVVNDNAKWHPLIADLDGDGDNEYTILDGDNLRIFENNDFDIVDTFAITVNPGITGSERYSNILAFDIDGDSRDEIIYIREKSGFLDIIEFNGSSVFAQNSISLNDSGLTNTLLLDSASEYSIKCQSTNKCLMTYANADISGATQDFFGTFFNSTFVGHENLILDLTVDNRLFCHPRGRSMAIADYDNDGIDELISTVYEARRTTASESIHIFWIEIFDNGTIELDNTFAISGTSEIENIYGAVAGDRCDGTGVSETLIGTQPSGVYFAYNLFTAPITFEIDGSGSNGQETAIAFVTDEDGDHWDFVIKTYDGCSSDLGFEIGCTISELDDYPETCDLLGNCGTAHALTNIYRANALPDATAGAVDFCASGITFATPTEASAIDTICGSSQKTVPILGIFDSQTMEIVLSEENIVFNTSIGRSVQDGRVNTIWHSAQHSSVSTNGQNLNEVITPYGVMRIANGDTSSPDWEIIFANPQATDGIMIPVDGEFSDSEDLLLYTSGNFFYIDDGLSNQGAFISNVTFRPCPIDAILKINTTLEIDVIIKDDNPSPLAQDPVTARVSVYNGDSNEQNDLPIEFNNVSSGALLPYSFILNKTITNSEILIEGFDSINLNDIDSQTFNFNVQLNGVEFGDTTCSVGFGAPSVEEEAPTVITEASLTVDATDNAIITGVFTVIALTGVSGITFWLVLMIAFAVAIFFRGAMIDWPMNTILGSIAVVEALLIILATRLGIFSNDLLVIITIIGVVIIGTFIGKFLTGIRPGGGT